MRIWCMRICVMRSWPVPGELKFLFICGVTVAILLPLYEHCVRYTFIGTLLNGKKTRSKKVPPANNLELAIDKDG